jgi:glycosyltransferase involved in cell wall biosynthesis
VPETFVAVEVAPDDVGAAQDLQLLASALRHAGVDAALEGWCRLPWDDEPVGDAPASGAATRLAAGPPATALRAASVLRAAPPVDGVPVAWTPRYEDARRVWVPNGRARDVLVDAGVARERLAVVPAVVDTDELSPEAAPAALPAARGFRFLAVLDWKLRKGWDVLVRAYVEEFAEHEDVTLVIKAWSSLGYDGAAIGDMLQTLFGDMGRDQRTVPDLALETVPTPRADLPGLYRAADCLVAPSRAQSWGRPVLEAMAAGLPVIGTPCGACADLLTPDIAFPIEHAAVPVPVAGTREDPACVGRWLEPDVGSLRHLMRAAVADREAGRAVGGRARAAVVARHSIASVADVAKAALEPVAAPRRRPHPPRHDGAAPDDVSFVIQGPIELDGPAWTARACAAIRAQFPGAEIVVSGWRGAQSGGLDCDEVVLSEDPGPVGSARFNTNVNRQIVSTMAGLRAASRPLVVKLRSDVVFHDAALLDHWGRWEERCDTLRLFERRVLVPNVFTRRPGYLAPLPFHPSDWSCMGTRADLERLFDIPLQTDAGALGGTPAPGIAALWSSDLSGLAATPEQYLWTSVLRRVAPGLRLEHVWDLTRETFEATEVSFANNLAILDMYVQYGASNAKYAYASRRRGDRTLYEHAQWLELYEVHCRGARDPDGAEAVLDRMRGGDWRVTDTDLAALRRGGRSWEAQLLEAMIAAPTIVRDPTIGAPPRTTMASAALAREELRALLAAG